MIKVRVTKRDIDWGDRYQNLSCPIALALRNKFNLEEGEVSVGENNYISIKQERYCIPKAALKFIRAFDDGKKVEPFILNLGKKYVK